MWVVSESARGLTKGDAGSPVIAAVPVSVGCTSALNGKPFQVGAGI